MAGATQRPSLVGPSHVRRSPYRGVGLATIVEYARALIDRAGTIPVKRLSRRVFHLAGLTLDVRGTDPTYLDLCAARLARVKGRGNGGERSMRIFALDAATLCWDPPAPWCDDHFSPVELNRILAASNLKGAHNLDASVWQFLDADTTVGVQYLASPKAYPPWDPAAPLRAFLHWSYSTEFSRVTHAGTLGLDGFGVLLAGRGGSGKSATTLAGVLSGLETAGDDFVVIDVRERPRAYPLYITLKLDMSGVERLRKAAMALPDGHANWQGKLEYDATKTGRGRMPDRLDIGAILLPRIAGGVRTEFTPATGSEALRALMPSSLFQIPEDYHQGFAFFGNLARKVPAFWVHLSSDPSEIARALTAFIRGGARSW